VLTAVKLLAPFALEPLVTRYDTATVLLNAGFLPRTLSPKLILYNLLRSGSIKKTLDVELTVLKSDACVYVRVLPAVVTETVILDVSVFALGNTNAVLAAENKNLCVNGTPSVICMKPLNLFEEFAVIGYDCGVTNVYDIPLTVALNCVFLAMLIVRNVELAGVVNDTRTLAVGPRVEVGRYPSIFARDTTLS
jgi:hypothetical protein